MDVRIDFNSWLPEKLDQNLSEKLINFYLSKFRQNINLHDKVNLKYYILASHYQLKKNK